MLAKDLFQKIGFTEEMIDFYNENRPFYGEECETLVRAYMREGKDYTEAYTQMRKVAPAINEYSSDIIFILECTGYLHEDYKVANISDEIFYNTMCDITYKMHEFYSMNGFYGTSVIKWQEDFLKLNRFALGRLQYDLWEHKEDSITVNGFKVENGFKTLSCHIPSSGPLTHEAVLDSLKQAYNFFGDRVNDGILLVECFSWLLFPNYLSIFKECANNTYSFIRNFYLYDTYKYETFLDGWRVYGPDFEKCDIEELPENTRLQKGFKEYLKGNNDFGGARGALLFDGENILTRRED